jgi:hypothetical protein
MRISIRGAVTAKIACAGAMMLHYTDTARHEGTPRARRAHALERRQA